MWTDPLPAWYAANGRHELPWRRTRDPWAVLVSEVMLQQTQVSRVLPRWRDFLELWPDPQALAASPLEDLLRWWRGLGYPRRALALHRCAERIAAEGWPRGEGALRALPGVGEYTARALLTLAFEQDAKIPLDVNIRRVAARAGCGAGVSDVGPAALSAVVEGSRPKTMPARDYVLALFDVGATHCRAAPRCEGCPLAAACTFATQPDAAARVSRRRQSPYRGSFRAVRGRVLAAMLAEPPPHDVSELVAQVPGIDQQTVQRALRTLVEDGLLRLTPAWDRRP